MSEFASVLCGGGPTGRSMKETLAWIDSLSPEACARHSWDELQYRLGRIGKGIQILHFTDTPVNPIVRVRLLNHPSSIGRRPSRIEVPLPRSVRDLSAREPDVVADFGRCHIPRSSVFYGALDQATAIAEMRPSEGALLAVSRWEPKVNEQLFSAVVGELDRVRRSGSTLLFVHNPVIDDIKKWLASMSTEDDFVRLVVDSFYASVLSRSVRTPDDYRITSALSSLMLNLGAKYSGTAEALYYPSVAFPGGRNIAITHACSRAKLQLIDCQILHVRNNFGFGIYTSAKIFDLDRIESDGSLVWKPFFPDSSWTSIETR